MTKRETTAPPTPEACAEEAAQYYDNARQILRTAHIHQNRYTDVKPVREACGTAYLAVLAAVRGYLLQQGVSPSRVPESYEALCGALDRHSRNNGKVKHLFFDAYSGLHIDGYYRGFTRVETGKSVFQTARLLIERLTGRKLHAA